MRIFGKRSSSDPTTRSRKAGKSKLSCLSADSTTGIETVDKPEHPNPEHSDPREDADATTNGRNKVGKSDHSDPREGADATTVPVATVTPDVFLHSFRIKASECLSNAYTAEHPIYRSREGRLTTSLGAELFALTGVLLDILDEYLSAGNLLNTDAGDAIIIDVMEFLILNLKYKQTHFRERRLQDVENCCAASNDFSGMVDTAEDMLSRVLNRYQLTESKRQAKTMLKKKIQDLISLYSSDAVYAAQMTYIFVFEPISDSIERDLFSKCWEENFTQNEVALSIVRTIEDFFQDIETYLGSNFVAKKVLDALVSATVVFYVRCLLLKATRGDGYWHRIYLTCKFEDPQRAMMRIQGDMDLMKNHFLGLTDRFPALARVIKQEFSILTTMYECACIGAGMSTAEIEDFVPILHKTTKHYDITRKVVTDLYSLVSSTDEHNVRNVLNDMKPQLVSFSNGEDEASHTEPPGRCDLPGLSVEAMLIDMYNLYGLGGRLHRLSPKHVIDQLRHGVAYTIREKRDHIEQEEDNSINTKIVRSLQELRDKSMRFERRAF